MSAGKLAYSYAEAAAAIGSSESVIKREVRDGNLPVKYIYSKPVILTDDLEAYAKALPNTPKKKKP